MKGELGRDEKRNTQPKLQTKEKLKRTYETSRFKLVRFGKLPSESANDFAPSEPMLLYLLE